MIKEYILQGLNCANCASQIGDAVGKMEGVSYASVNFVTATLRIEISDSHVMGLLEKIKRVVHQHEPETSVVEKVNTTRIERGKTGKNNTLLIIIGAIILFAGIALEHLLDTNRYVPIAVFVLGYLLLGSKVILRAARNIPHGKIFDENLLMTVATIGAFAIGDYAEAVAVMLFYRVGEYVQAIAVGKTKKTIAGLMDIRPDFANLQIDGQIQRVAPESVNVGDVIVVKPGEKVPLDGVVLDGESMLDMVALTGEFVPRRVTAHDVVLSGCINQNGVLTILVTQTFGESTTSKIINLVENAASKKAPTESFITKFARYYTPVVIGLAMLIVVIPPLVFGGVWADWLNRGLVFLVISCPCALVISVPLSYFSGIGCASRKGILIKGGNYLEALNALDLVILDKTGTLTEGVFNVVAIHSTNGFSEHELLEAAANAEAFSNHPIALSILREYDKEVDKNTLTDYREIAGLGVSVVANGKTVLAGNKALMENNAVAFKESQNVGTKVYVAADGQFMGCIIISDVIKQDSHIAIAALKELGVKKTVMLTGDDPSVAEAVARELKIDEVFGGLLPQRKVEIMEMLIKQKCTSGKTAFVGDGVNDAPVLAMADIGVAMGGLGSDAAIEAADVVLMTDELSKLSEAVEIARFTRRIVWQNISFVLCIKVLFLLLGAFGIANMWEAVFADVGVSVLAVLNTLRVLKR